MSGLADPVEIERQRTRKRLEKRRERQARRRAGACHWCWSAATVGGYCAAHHAKNAARNALRTRHA